MKILGNRILVRFDKPETISGSLYIPPIGAQGQWATVVDVGEGIRREDGTFAKPDVDIGDRVFCGKHVPKADNYRGGDERLVIMLAEYVPAKISKKDL